MKTLWQKLLAGGVLLALVALLSACSNDGFTYQVNDVASDPGAFNGPLSVVGIVNAYSPNDPQLVGIMDLKELQCSTPGCNKVLLPVRFSGERPVIGAQVKASGKIVGGKTLQAEKLDVQTIHTLGGQ